MSSKSSADSAVAASTSNRLPLLLFFLPMSATRFRVHAQGPGSMGGEREGLRGEWCRAGVRRSSGKLQREISTNSKQCSECVYQGFATGMEKIR
jgi:hypothetical protein